RSIEPDPDRPAVAEAGHDRAAIVEAAGVQATHRLLPAERHELGERHDGVTDRIHEAGDHAEREDAVTAVDVPQPADPAAVAHETARIAEQLGVAAVQLEARAGARLLLWRAGVERELELAAHELVVVLIAR